MKTFKASLNWLQNNNDYKNLLKNGINRGLEKEGLRVSPNMRPSDAPHPAPLGSALTHKYITTDFAENLLEFITGVSNNATNSLNELADIQAFACQNIGKDIIWPSSIPCPIDSPEQIPLAQYGKSHLGRIKTLYRSGLKHRYGAIMQSIAGIHFNISLPENFLIFFKEFNQYEGEDFKTQLYLSMIRNIHIHGWVIPFLFGSSPAFHNSFLERGHKNNYDLLNLKKGEAKYLKYATSLRMSDIGYQTNAQDSLNICYNTLESYIKALHRGMKTPYPVFQSNNNEQIQISDNILQIENEYYGTVRPKRITLKGESPTKALSLRGIEYLEIRSLDLNPFSPFGIDLQQIYFLDIFLIYCLLEPGPSCDPEVWAQNRKNFKKVVVDGRNPNLKLENEKGTIPLESWGKEIFEKLEMIAEILGEPYLNVVQNEKKKIENYDTTPSAKILLDLNEGGQTFEEYFYQLGEKHKKFFLNYPLSKLKKQNFEELAKRSIEEQKQIEEKKEELNFSDYLKNYLKRP